MEFGFRKLCQDCVSQRAGGWTSATQFKPNSITLAGSELIRSWFAAGSKLVRSWFDPDSVMEFGFLIATADQ